MGDEGDERETADCGITGQQISRTEDKQNRLPEEQHIRKIIRGSCNSGRILHPVLLQLPYLAAVYKF